MKYKNEFVGPNMPRSGNAVTRWIGDIILKMMGWTVTGKLPNRKQIILIGGPHTSNWDLPLALATMLSVGVKFSWMMKKEAFLWPLGHLWEVMGGIPIDRKANLDVVTQMKNWFDKNEKVWLGITPEGTRSKVERYKTGYIRISKAVGVPLFIVGVDALKKCVVFDRIWEPDGEIEIENKAIQNYIESNYNGIRD